MVTLRFTAYSPDEKGAGGAGHNDPNPAILTDIYAPLTRKEMIQSGMDVDPLTRDEYFLKKQMEQSGGGGSDLPEPFIVHFTIVPHGNYDGATADKTFSEMKAAYDAGRLLVGIIDDTNVNCLLFGKYVEFHDRDDVYENIWFTGTSCYFQAGIQGIFSIYGYTINVYSHGNEYDYGHGEHTF